MAPGASRRSAASNSGVVSPAAIWPRLPPCPADGQAECASASAANSPGAVHQLRRQHRGELAGPRVARGVTGVGRNQDVRRLVEIRGAEAVAVVVVVAPAGRFVRLRRHDLALDQGADRRPPPQSRGGRLRRPAARRKSRAAAPLAAAVGGRPAPARRPSTPPPGSWPDDAEFRGRCRHAEFRCRSLRTPMPLGRIWSRTAQLIASLRRTVLGRRRRTAANGRLVRTT